MELIATPVGLLTLMTLVFSFLFFASTLPAGAMSLPCMTALTSFIYFYLMPVLYLSVGKNEFLGMYLTSLEWPHFAVLLYLIGVVTACVTNRRYLALNPAAPRATERQLNLVVLRMFWAVCVVGVGYLMMAGFLNILGDKNYTFTESGNNLLFINMAFTMMIPLALICLIRDGFGVRSLVLLAVVLLILLQTGFRYRIMILLSATAVSFAMVRRFKIRVSYVVLGTVGALLLANGIGKIRQYASGVNLSKMDGLSWDEILTSFDGEIGPIFSFAYTASNPLPELALFDPWTVGFARLIPSFLWPDKPLPHYLGHYAGGFTVAGANNAGIAAPQHVEMLLQFGWFGVPFLSWIYFSIAIYLMYKLNRLGREARIAGCAIAPAFFGFYMQQRGYFFQIFSDSLFAFGPLFLVHLWEKRLPVKPGIGPRARQTTCDRAGASAP